MTDQPTTQQCPTCGSNDRRDDRSPTSTARNWHQYRRDVARFTCPDSWHTTKAKP